MLLSKTPQNITEVKGKHKRDKTEEITIPMQEIHTRIQFTEAVSKIQIADAILGIETAFQEFTAPTIMIVGAKTGKIRRLNTHDKAWEDIAPYFAHLLIQKVAWVEQKKSYHADAAMQRIKRIYELSGFQLQGSKKKITGILISSKVPYGEAQLHRKRIQRILVALMRGIKIEKPSFHIKPLSGCTKTVDCNIDEYREEAKMYNYVNSVEAVQA